MNHAAAWLVWVGAILIILSTTRNPWYVGLVLVAIAVVRAAIQRAVTSSPPLPVSILRFGLFVVTFSAIFNAFSVHFGDTVLFVIPPAIPYFGGPVTLEALVYGMVNGLKLTGLFAAFAVFNQVITIRQMIRLTPQAFFPVAVVVSIAVTFVPVTLRHLKDIREAQAVRGHRLRGLRDWLPLVMPLLVGGLERALQLAEAMTARGFASANEPGYDAVTRPAILLGLTLLVGGWLLRLGWGYAAVGLLLLLIGIGLIIGALWHVGRQVSRTNYRPQPWTGADWAIVGGAAVAALAFVVPWPGLDRSSIFFYPYPQLSWPAFQPLLGLAIAGLLMPVFPSPRRRRDSPLSLGEELGERVIFTKDGREI
jgi:energy-coupling factor transport system permease protein